MESMSANFRARGSNVFAGIAARVSKDSIFVLAAFMVPLVLRSVPEIIMGPFLVGFDTLAYYVPMVMSLSIHGTDFLSFLATAPLLYALLWGLVTLGMPIVVAVKVLSPVLYGFLGLSIFFYAQKGLEWSRGKSLVVALLATSYFVTLRISWDMLRNELGLIFLFVALIFLFRNRNRLRDYAALSFVMILTVLSHQYVSILLLSMVLAAVMFEWHENLQRAGKLVLAAVPSALLFLLILYTNVTLGKNFWSSSYSSSAWYRLFRFFAPEGALLNTLGFLLFCYLPLLPLVFLGAKRLSNVQFPAWIVASLMLVIVAIAFPTYNPTGYRWILMLVFPLSFYATEGLLNMKRKGYQAATIGVLAFLASSFVFLPSQIAFPYYGVYSWYMPSSMLQNTISLSDSSDTVNVLDWAKNNLGNDGWLLTHDAFHGWATLVLSEEKLVCYQYENPESAAEKVLENGHSELYLIWWTKGGWHGLTSVPASFEEVYHSGNIGLFKYTSTQS